MCIHDNNYNDNNNSNNKVNNDNNKKNNNNYYYYYYYFLIKLYNHPHVCYLSKKVSGKSVDKSGHGYQWDENLTLSLENDDDGPAVKVLIR